MMVEKVSLEEGQLILQYHDVLSWLRGQYEVILQIRALKAQAEAVFHNPGAVANPTRELALVRGKIHVLQQKIELQVRV